MYSRLILGVHTIDQVVYAAQLGIWSAFFLHFCVKPILEPEIIRLLTGQITEFKQRYIKATVCYVIMLVFVLVYFTIMDVVITNNNLNKQEWIDNIIADGCESKLEHYPF